MLVGTTQQTDKLDLRKKVVTTNWCAFSRNKRARLCVVTVGTKLFVMAWMSSSSTQRVLLGGLCLQGVIPLLLHVHLDVPLLSAVYS